MGVQAGGTIRGILNAGLALNSDSGALSCQAMKGFKIEERLWATYSNDCLSLERTENPSGPVRSFPAVGGCCPSLPCPAF